MVVVVVGGGGGGGGEFIYTGITYLCIYMFRYFISRPAFFSSISIMQY